MKKNNQRAFTLLEVLIVLAILASMFAFIPRMRSNPKNNIKAVTRNLAITVKQIRHMARTKNATYRLVLKMGQGDDSYWIESAPGAILIKSEDREKREASLNEEDRPKTPFSKTSVPGSKDTVKLPDKLFITQVETASQNAPITSGTAYIYFSPEGLVEKSTVQIGNGKDLVWTLIFNPLTGHSDIVENAVSLKSVTAE